MTTIGTKAWWSKSHVLLAVGAVFVAMIIFMPRLRGPDARLARTLHALNRFQGYLSGYQIGHSALPLTLHDAIESLERQGIKYNEESGIEITKPGFDGWGRELIYELRDPEHAVVRSRGANGVDEKGEGDDRQREVPAP